MKIRILVLSFVLLSLTSCFEVVEELDLKKDGSGTFTFTLNFSQSKTELNTIMGMDSLKGVKIPTKKELMQYIMDAKSIMGKQRGISGVTSTQDLENYIVVSSFNFDSLHHLTLALQNSYTYFSKSKTLPSDGFSIGKGFLERKSSLDSFDFFDKIDKDKREAFKNATYTCVYRFDEEVKSMTNKNAIKSGNSKAVMLKTSMKDILNRTKSIINKIYF